MIVDSSALVAIALDGVEAGEIAELLEATPWVRMSAVTVVETSVLLGALGQGFLDGWLSSTGCHVVPFDEAQALVARWAFLTYGRVSGSEARLNLGDCFAYALAKVTGEPLLFTGAEFAHTDVRPAYDRG
jgi:ribonuclease VapC